MALSSNSNAGSTETKVGAGALSNFNTENKSNGNFSGGDINFDTSKLNINNPFDTKEPQQPTFNTDDVFKPTLSGNLYVDLPKTNNNSSNTTYSNNSPEPTMTVDEVYGKSSNQPVVEKQGDYATSSNEKSNVETSTFGKQDEVSVTPTSVTENKGVVENATIQSVEGLDFQQKDKASVDVLDSKKKRDEVEAEDRADSMRNKLKANVNNAKQQEGGEDFQIGTSEAEKAFNEEKATRQKQLQQKKKALNETNKAIEEAENAKSEADKKVKIAKQDYQKALSLKERCYKASQSTISSVENLDDSFFGNLLAKTKVIDLEKPKKELAVLAKRFDIEIGDISEASVSELKVIAKKVVDDIRDIFDQDLETAEKNLAEAQKQRKDIETKQYALKNKSKELESEYNKEKKDYNIWIKEQDSALESLSAQSGAETSHKDAIENSENATPEQKAQAEEVLTNLEDSRKELEDAAAKTKAEETVATETPQYGAETSYNNAINAIKNSKDATPEQKAQAEEVLTNLEDSRKELAAAAAKARSGNPADLVVYQKALETYNKNLKEAQKIGNRWTQTDFNLEYTKAVAQANDFKVTLSDGTVMEYSDFATEEATKSPQYAKAMYEAKAAELEEKGHPVLAKIERMKAEWSQTWLGSKFTFADDQVRRQFNQMAKTDMRATYATYNNVLSDPDATPEAKAEASAAINQANSLMTASAALQASTGFFSGIGDGTSDGVYGVTNPEALNGYQKALNVASNFAKITLRLGVTPGANEAYQNMYYLAGAKVNESGLFTTDFNGDGFVLCQEYGNNAAVGMIAGAGELAAGVVLMFNPATPKLGLNLIRDSVQTFLDGLYGVQKEVNKSIKYSGEVLSYLNEAKSIAAETGNKEATSTMDSAIKQIEDFQLKSDEVGNLDNWLEGSGSNTADNGKFNQALTYDEWLKLIEADPVMKEYAKSLAEKKKDKNVKKDNADARVNS